MVNIVMYILILSHYGHKLGYYIYIVLTYLKSPLNYIILVISMI